MGEKFSANKILFFLSDDGEYMRIGCPPEWNVPTVTAIQENSTEEDFKGIMRMGTITGTVKLPTCHSRKRYVKLLMASGISKNRANLRADIALAEWKSWKSAWRAYIYFRTCATITAEIVSAVLPKKLSEEEREIQCLIG